MKKTGWILIILLGVAFVMLNWQIPRVIDDYPYSRSFVGVASMEEDQNMDATIENLSDLCASQTAHYKIINGRALVHSVVQMFCCWFGQVPFDILQGIILVLCMWLMSRHVGQRNVMAGAVVMLLYMLLFREPACIYHGVACGVNYLWTLTLMLGFRWLFVREGTKAWLLGVMAFVAGFSNEAIAIPFAGAFALEMLTRWKQSTTTQRIIVLTMCVGTLLLVVAPANFVRLGHLNETECTSTLPLHLQPLPNLRITMVCVVMMMVAWFKRRTFVKENVFWLEVIVLSALMSLAIGGENIRQCITAEVCSAMLIVKLSMEWLDERWQKGIMVGSTCLLGLILVGINLIQRPASQQFEEARRYVEQSKEMHVVIPITPTSFSPQIEKYRCCELSDFQLEQFRWWYRKEKVELADE